MTIWLAVLPLLSAVAAVNADTSLVSKADELNARYVECLFAVAREAREKAVEEEGFQALLAGSCDAERSQLREVFLSVRQRRGVSPSQARADWARLEAEGRASVERAYRIGRALAN